MTKATRAPHASSSMLPAPSTAAVKIPRNPLLITFLMKKDGPEIQLRCRGCREIIPLEHLRPSQIRGVIELDGQPVLVIDANARLGMQETEIGPCSCIVVIERDCESRSLRIGAIVGDIDEVMQLAAAADTTPIETGISTNMDLVVELFNAAPPNERLTEVHRELGLLGEELNPTLADTAPVSAGA